MLQDYVLVAMHNFEWRCSLYFGHKIELLRKECCPDCIQSNSTSILTQIIKPYIFALSQQTSTPYIIISANNAILPLCEGAICAKTKYKTFYFELSKLHLLCKAQWYPIPIDYYMKPYIYENIDENMVKITHAVSLVKMNLVGLHLVFCIL